MTLDTVPLTEDHAWLSIIGLPHGSLEKSSSGRAVAVFCARTEHKATKPTQQAQGNFLNGGDMPEIVPPSRNPGARDYDAGEAAWVNSLDTGGWAGTPGLHLDLRWYRSARHYARSAMAEALGLRGLRRLFDRRRYGARQFISQRVGVVYLA